MSCNLSRNVAKSRRQFYSCTLFATANNVVYSLGFPCTMRSRPMHFRFLRRIAMALLLALFLASIVFMATSLNETLKQEIPVQLVDPLSPDNDENASDILPFYATEDASPSQPEPSPTVEKKRRKSVLIFGDDRSGTTFLTRLFSEDPQNFVVYEPLWIPKSWKNSREKVYGEWGKNVRDLTSALLTCKFSRTVAGTRFLAYTKRKWADGLFHNPFVVPPFCNAANAKDCPFLSAKFAEEICATQFKHSVVKAALVRVPDRKLSNLIPQMFEENLETDIKVLHVVRDPRGSVNSRINSHWIPDYTSKSFPILVRDTCEGITPNVRFGRSLVGWQKDRYKLVRYKDLAGAPLKTAQELYDFAGFEMPESLKDWIAESTNPSKEKLARESKKTFSTVRNSTANIEKWREQSSVERNRIIQNECSELFDLLELDRL